MGMKYFVMTISPAVNDRGWPIPVVNADDDVMLFDSEEEANERVKDQVLCKAGGWEVFPWPHVN